MHASQIVLDQTFIVRSLLEEEKEVVSKADFVLDESTVTGHEKYLNGGELEA